MTEQKCGVYEICWNMDLSYGDKTGICIGTDMLKFSLLFLHYK